MKRHKYNYTPGPSDLCQTPGYAIEPLLDLTAIRNIESIWEPACGQGYLMQAIANRTGILPFITDIDGQYSEQHDFLNDELPFSKIDIDAIITNPPYSIKDKFIRRCYEIGLPWALLMPVDTIGNKYFIEMANEFYPKPGIIFFSPRVDFKMPNKGWEGKGSHYSVAWYTWKMGFEGNVYKRMNWTKEYKESFQT